MLGTLGPGDFWIACLFVTIMSMGSVVGQVLAPSAMSDAIDYDELRSGERKEGSYFAVRSFCTKVGFGLGPLAVGALLTLTGFDPAAPIGPDAIFGMRLLIGVVPALGALAGAAILLLAKLDEAAHAEIRAELDARLTRGA